MDTESAREMIERNYHPKQTGPAPKDEGMEIRTGFLPRPEEATERRATELRAVYERAYFAALGGMAGIDGLADVETVYHAQQCALETVRQWPAMMAELEQEIAK